MTRQIDTYVINKATLEILDTFHFIFVRMGANLWVRMRLAITGLSRYSLFTGLPICD